MKKSYLHNNKRIEKSKQSGADAGFFWSDITTTECVLKTKGKEFPFQAKIFIPLEAKK